MKRNIIKTDGTHELTEVGDGYQSWNRALDISTGEIVRSPDGSIELWCDENGLCMAEPQLNRAASLLVGSQIVGDVIVFYPGDIT